MGYAMEIPAHESKLGFTGFNSPNLAVVLQMDDHKAGGVNE